MILNLQFVELLGVLTFDIQGSDFSELVGKDKPVRGAWCSLYVYTACVIYSIGCLAFFGPCDIQVEPGV